MVVVVVVVVLVVVVAVVWVHMNIVYHSHFLSVEIGEISNFGEFKECVSDGPTDGPTDRPTDGPTDGQTLI